MVLGISDAQGLTSYISKLRSEKKDEEVADLYRNLFLTHRKVLRAFPACNWELVKTTGDGVMFFSEAEPCEAHLQTLPALQAGIRGNVANGAVGLRVIGCYLNAAEIVRAPEICENATDCGMNWLANDLFGHRLNIAFRLLSSVSAAVAVVDHELLSLIFSAESKNKCSFDVGRLGLGFLGPVPVTSLKGIKETGFSDAEGHRTPQWLWEVRRA